MWCWETAISGAAGTSCSIKHRRQIICSKIKATKPRHSNKFTINFYHCEKKFVRSSEIKKKKMRRHHSPGYVPTQYLHHWRIYSYISILSHNQVSFLKVSWAEFRCYIPHTLVYILQNCPFPHQDLSILLIHHTKESQPSHRLVGDSTVHLKQRSGILYSKNQQESSGRESLKSSVIVRSCSPADF